MEFAEIFFSVMNYKSENLQTTNMQDIRILAKLYNISFKNSHVKGILNCYCTYTKHV